MRCFNLHQKQTKTKKRQHMESSGLQVDVPIARRVYIQGVEWGLITRLYFFSLQVDGPIA